MKNKNRIRLGVNVDHVATLRQVRGGKTPYPQLVDRVQDCMRAGADQITVHLREDRRHIQPHDVVTLSQKCEVDLNLEMAVTPKMVNFANKIKPEWCCFVPEKRQELTTEGGLDVIKNKKNIKKAIEKLQGQGIEISLFIAPEMNQVKAAFEVGADAIEFHTGHWVGYQGLKKKREWNRLVRGAMMAHHLGLRVHAGHGLDYEHTLKIKKLPFLKEVNIGHFLICEALKAGLFSSVKKMVQILK
jgi:pyridoxine 5-phosphate synthase